MLLLKLLFLPFKDWTVKPFNGYSFKRGLQGEIAEPDNKTSYCFNYTCNIQDLFLFLKKWSKQYWSQCPENSIKLFLHLLWHLDQPFKQMTMTNEYFVTLVKTIKSDTKCYHSFRIFIYCLISVSFYNQIHSGKTSVLQYIDCRWVFKDATSGL